MNKAQKEYYDEMNYYKEMIQHMEKEIKRNQALLDFYKEQKRYFEELFDDEVFLEGDEL